MRIAVGLRVTDTQSNTVTYAYDPFGNLTSTNAGGVATTLAYDLRGRKTSMTDPDMGTWTYAYNALGELIRQVDAKSQTTSMQYDLLGPMTTRTEADLVSTWSYDACTKGVGKLCSVSSDNGYARTHSYDRSGSTRLDSSRGCRPREERTAWRRFAGLRVSDEIGSVTLATIPVLRAERCAFRWRSA